MVLAVLSFKQIFIRNLMHGFAHGSGNILIILGLQCFAREKIFLESANTVGFS